MLLYMVKRDLANAVKLQVLQWEGNPGSNIIMWIREMAVSEGFAALFLVLEFGRGASWSYTGMQLTASKKTRPQSSTTWSWALPRCKSLRKYIFP